jgi:two-component system phosphate regulon response regulator PhoB
MLTAKGEESDIVAGLEVGADDYITKPFSPKVLIARIRTIFRRETRKTVNEFSVIKIDELTINSDKYEVLIKDTPLKLTNNEFQALFLLAGQRGWVFTRNQIINSISGNDHDVTDRSIDVLIVGLRKKLASYSEYIETVHGVGYRFKGQ